MASTASTGSVEEKSKKGQRTEQERGCSLPASIAAHIRAWASVVRLRPSILLIPLLFFAVTVSLGVWGLLHAADVEANSQMSATQAFGETVARSIASAVPMLYMPVQAMASSVRTNPRWDTVMSSFIPFAKNLFLTANTTGSLLSLWPQGIITVVTQQSGGSPPAPPRSPPSAASDSPATALRPDLFDPPTQQMKNELLRYLAMGGVYLTGPLFIPWGNSSTDGYFFATAFVPVFVANVSESETFGIPGYNGSVKCSICYNATTGTKFWGMVSSSILLNPIFDEAQQTLKSRGYRYSFVNPSPLQGAALLNWVSEIFSSDVPPVPGISIPVALDAGGAKWLLTLSPQDGYTPSWKNPLIAVVVVMTFMLAVLLHLLLLSRFKHRLLLEAILPPKVIDRMHSGLDMYLNNMGKYTTTGSPADKILSVTEELLEGKQPPLRDVVLIRKAIKESANIYSPLDVTDNIRAALDDDIAQSLLQQLQLRRGELGKISPEHLRDSASFSSEEDPRFLDVQQGLAALLEMDRLDIIDRAGATQLVSSIAGSTAQLAMGSTAQLAMSSTAQLMLGNLQADGAVATASTEDQAGVGNAQPLDIKRGGSGPCSPLGNTPHLDIKRGGSATSQSGIKVHSSRLFPLRLMKLTDNNGSPDSANQLSSQQDDSSASPSVAAHQVVPRFPVDEVEAVLAGSWDWQFDVFKLNEVTGGRPLSALAFYAMHHTGLVKQLNINGAKLARFLRATENNYKANPYHNAAHAAGVLHTMHVMMQRGGLAPSLADPLTHMACLLAAVVHDVDHTGRTNDFLVGTGDDLALLYNDKSPQENHHLAVAFSLLKQLDYNFLSCMSSKDRTELRRLVIELVLATDMKVHFQLVSHFGMLHRLGEGALHGEFCQGSSTQASLKSKVLPSTETPSGSKPSDSRGEAQKPVAHDRQTPNRMKGLSVEASTLTAPEPARRHTSNGGVGRSPTALPQNETRQRACADETERLLSLQIALKCSDLSHMGSPLPVHLRWVAALEEEFFRQGDAERQASLPISPLFDRQKPGVSRSQPGFFEFVVIPLFSNFARAFPSVEPLHNAMMANYHYWLAEKARQASQDVRAPT